MEQETTNLDNPFLSLSIFSHPHIPEETRNILRSQLEEYWHILAQELSRPASPWLEIPHQENSFQDLIEAYVQAHDQNRSKAADRMRFISHVLVPLRSISSDEGTEVLKEAINKCQLIFEIAEQIKENITDDETKKTLTKFKRIIGPFAWPYDGLH